MQETEAWVIKVMKGRPFRPLTLRVPIPQSDKLDLLAEIFADVRNGC
jgi:hypothetical protein